ncbi:hypothetical protein PENTCL1PPCAC_2987, partial [Pristionchus entomophagus]
MDGTQYIPSTPSEITDSDEYTSDLINPTASEKPLPPIIDANRITAQLQNQNGIAQQHQPV